MTIHTSGDRCGTRGPRSAVDPFSGLNELWADTVGDSRIRIAILDAPIDCANPCLESAQIEQTWLGDIGDCASHGTEVASILLAAHNTSVRGIAPGCSAVSLPIFGCEPSRSPSTHQQHLANAVYEALSAGAHVVNISAGQLSPGGSAAPELIEAVRACAAAGILIVSAAGNEGCDCLHVPAALPCVLAVGAMRQDGDPLPGSNWGATYETQGVWRSAKTFRSPDRTGEGIFAQGRVMRPQSYLEWPPCCSAGN